MAILLRGKNKGKTVIIRQWCNDWFMIEPGGIISPGSIKLNKEEIKRIKEHRNNGILLKLYNLMPNGTFKRKKRNIQWLINV